MLGIKKRRHIFPASIASKLQVVYSGLADKARRSRVNPFRTAHTRYRGKDIWSHYRIIFQQFPPVPIGEPPLAIPIDTHFAMLRTSLMMRRSSRWRQELCKSGMIILRMELWSRFSGRWKLLFLRRHCNETRRAPSKDPPVAPQTREHRRCK